MHVKKNRIIYKKHLFKRTIYRNIFQQFYFQCCFFFAIILKYLNLFESLQVAGRPSEKFSRMYPWRAVLFTGQRLYGVMCSSLAWSQALDSEKVFTASLSSYWRWHSFHVTTSRMSLEWWRNKPQPTSSNSHVTTGTSGSRIQFSPSAPGASTSSPLELTTT